MPASFRPGPVSRACTSARTASTGRAGVHASDSAHGAGQQPGDPELVDRGVAVSDVFHREGPGKPALRGPHPERRSYFSYATFSDPDGNEWLLQEVTTRFPGRIDSNATSFASASDLASAMRRASVAHGEHETRTGGQRDENWPDWYSAYMVAEQAGTELPE